MTATFLLIRHAAHGHLGETLSGRVAGIPLSEEGRRQAERLAEALSRSPPDVLQSSPVQRAQETAGAVARRFGLAVETVAALDEIDFGDWAGRSFDDLAGDPAWQAWNACRSTATAPGGETMRAAQTRAIDHLRESASRFAGGTVAMVTHCDIIRGIIAEILDLSLDRILRFDIAPASVSRVAAGHWGERVLSMNEEVRCNP